MATEIDIRLTRLDRNTITFQAINSKTKAGINLTGGKARFSAYTDEDDPFGSRVAAIDKTITEILDSSKGQITDAANGKGSFFFLAADSAALTVEKQGSYFYGILVRDNNGDPWTVARGRLTWRREAVEDPGA